MNLEPHIDPAAAKLVTESSKYRLWRGEVQKSGCEILEEKMLYVLQRNKNSFYTALLDCKLLTPEKQIINRSLLLRGRSVVIIPLFQCGNKTVIPMVQQRRIVDGDFSMEFPSGGIDESIDIRTAAVTEIKEELEIDIQPDELISLYNRPLKACESMFDELVYWFAFKRNVTEEFLKQLENRKTGCAANEEHIYVTLQTPADLYKSASFQTLVGSQLLLANGLVDLSELTATISQ
jgi:8-oxo-dGTP pyrophosphatase MutT (NUDIX family)